MSTITVTREIETARGQVTSVFEGLREDMTAMFWEGFGAAAAAYRGARSEGPAADRFAGVVRELIRDAKETASDPTLRRGAPVPAEYGTRETDTRETPPVLSRTPWATMPTDGSGRLTVPERIVYGVIGAACLAVLVVLGFLVSESGSSPDAPAFPALVADASPVADAADVRESERDLIMRGADWSWGAYTECGYGPAACDAALREINRQARPYGIHVWEDGSVSPLD